MFKFIAHSRIIHNAVSFFVNLFPILFTHNFSKYFILKKILYAVNIDNIEGDYCEFGCFTGASLNHALRAHKKFMPNRSMIFYGFDSFEGFPIEAHQEFSSKVFKSNFKFVKKLEKKFNNCKIIKGFFENTLNEEKINDSIKHISVAFLDCDLGISSEPVFNFIKNRLSNGAFIIIDDFFNIDSNQDSILKRFNKHFILNKNVFIHNYFGNAGIVFKYIKS
jgi:hypothetical protein